MTEKFVVFMLLVELEHFRICSRSGVLECASDPLARRGVSQSSALEAIFLSLFDVIKAIVIGDT